MARISPFVVIPPLAFAALAAVFVWGLDREAPNELPSTFVGREVPGLPAQALPGQRLVTMQDLTSGKVTLVNFWASWCPPCRAEHPTLQALADQGIPIIGMNFKDKESQATAYLAAHGDPFVAGGFDPSGRLALDWGVTAPPETFIVDGDGKVLYRFTGPLIREDYQNRFVPQLEKALATQN